MIDIVQIWRWSFPFFLREVFYQLRRKWGRCPDLDEAIERIRPEYEDIILVGGLTFQA